MELEKLPGLELGSLVNRREISPVEVISYFLKRINAYNSNLNAFVYTKAEDALKEAIKLEKRIMSGEYVGPFAGVPVCLKDFLPSKKGWTNTHGGVKHLEAIDTEDSMFYTAARDLGAIAIGKTNAPPFGFKGTCDNSMYGPTKNPFNYEYNSGGSSGGTAAAVGSGLIPMGEGGDAGGSIRIPASWCNCFGFKASRGTVPSYCRPDGWAATHPFCVNGVITRTVADSAAILTSMARYNPKDPTSLPINSGKNFSELINKPISDLKIGFTPDFNLYPVEDSVLEVVNNAVESFKLAGVTVEPVKFNFKHSLKEFARCWSWSISVDTALDLVAWKRNGLNLIKDHSDELTKEFIHWNEYAFEADIFNFRKFNEIRTDVLDQFETAFEDYDIILSPTTCCPPVKNNTEGHVPTIAGVDMDPMTDMISFCQTFLINFVGYPAASVPAGLTKQKLPVGLQIIGKQFMDEDVLSVSRTYEAIHPWVDYYKISYNMLRFL